MRSFPGILVSLLALAAARAETPHPIDARMEKCVAANPSTHGALQCHETALKEWDAELNRAYREMRSASTEAEKAQLLTAQRAWLAYRDAEFALIDRVYGSRDGTMFQPMRSHRRMSVVRARALELASYARLPR